MNTSQLIEHCRAIFSNLEEVNDNLYVYFSESIHPVSFQTVQPDQGFFFLAVSHPVGSIAA